MRDEHGPLTTRFDCDGRNGRELCNKCGLPKPAAPVKPAPVRTDADDTEQSALTRMHEFYRFQFARRSL